MMPIPLRTLPAALAMLLLAAVTATALPPAQAADAPRCQYVQIARLPLRYTGPSLMLTIEGRINGAPAEMLVDTGAYATFLTRTGTDRFGLSLSSTGQVAYGIGGIASIYKTRVDEFSAGPARAAKGYLPVLTDFGFTPSFDAILGAPFLLQADLEISLASKELGFFRPHDCKDGFLAYWDPAAVVVPFERGSKRGSNPAFSVLVNGVELRAIIDSGAATTAISLAAAKRAGLRIDAPEVKRIGHSVGLGDKKAATWHAVFPTLEIGAEKISNAYVAVVDKHGTDTELLLGADFLRAHRVLFAMSQQKLYLSYLGGDPFSQRRTIEPWMREEAEAGNADAQMALSRAYRNGDKVDKDPALAAAWLDKAVQNGSPAANIARGRELMLAGQAAEGAAHLRTGLDKLPSNRSAALWLHLARLRMGRAELARSELISAFEKSDDDEWPRPIADYYLGKITAAKLLAEAADARAGAARARCDAFKAMAEWHAARGEQATADGFTAQATGPCGGTAAAKTAAPEAGPGQPAPSTGGAGALE